MSIVASDIKFRLSGGGANTDPDAALGGAKSSTQVVDNTLENLFDSVSGAEHAAGRTEYRCIYVHNAHATLALTTAKFWLPSDTPSADTDLSVAVGTSAVNGTEQTIANETTAPTGVTWSDAATSHATGLALGDIPAGQHRAVWIRRTTSAGSTAAPGDTASLQAGGDTL